MHLKNQGYTIWHVQKLTTLTSFSASISGERNRDSCTSSNNFSLNRGFNLTIPSVSNRTFGNGTQSNNRPLVPLFQNESKCETFHMKMSSACSFIFMQIKVIFIWRVLLLDSFWNRGSRKLRNGLIFLGLVIEHNRTHTKIWSMEQNRTVGQQSYSIKRATTELISTLIKNRVKKTKKKCLNITLISEKCIFYRGFVRCTAPLIPSNPLSAIW